MKIFKCLTCGAYTIKGVCVKCNIPSKNVSPARYSPQDPYGKYRRMMKSQMGDE